MHCLYIAYALPIHCLCTASTLPTHCLCTAYTLPVQLPMQLSIALPNATLYAYALSMHCPCNCPCNCLCLCSLCSLCTAYALSMYCLCSAYALSMHCYVSDSVKFTTFSCFIRIKRDPFSLILRHALANMCFYICTKYYGAKRFRSQSSFSPNRSICDGHNYPI
jgi:hypothetical protein